MTNNQKKNDKEKEYDPDIHGGGVESFGTYTPPKTKDEKDKYVEPGSCSQE